MTQKLFIMKLFSIGVMALRNDLLVDERSTNDELALQYINNRKSIDVQNYNYQKYNDEDYNEENEKLSVKRRNNNKKMNLNLREVNKPKKLENTIGNFVRKACFLVTLFFFNLSGGSFNLINLLDCGMLGMRGLMIFVNNSKLEKLYMELLPVYMTITLFRLIIGNAMSATSLSTYVFAGTLSMWQYGAIIFAITMIPVAICYLMKEGKGFVIRNTLQKGILVAICFYYSFFVFSPLSSLLESAAAVKAEGITVSNIADVMLNITSILDLSYIFCFFVWFFKWVVPIAVLKALVTVIQCAALVASTYLACAIFDRVVSINSDNIFDILMDFYFGDSESIPEEKTFAISVGEKSN